jgi:putative nucleotidyltransferase with HDIG domain
VTRILFVDDEPKVLDGLRRMLYSFRKQWDMVFVTSGAEALERLAESEFDLLITDVRMPRMTGIELLEQVLQRHPRVVRMVLSGTVDQEITLRSVTLAHQYLIKPCDPATLQTAVERLAKLRHILDHPGLEPVISGMRSLPSCPEVYTRLVSALASPHASVKEIGIIIEQDPAMAAKILQLVNSAFFGHSRHISGPGEAAVYLGIETIKALVLTISAFSQFDSHAPSGFSIESVQQHSLMTATIARRIAETMSLGKGEVEDAFMGGLLHDIGHLVLATNYPAKYRDAAERANGREAPTIEAENEIFGATHAQVGAYLLWLWGLSDRIVEIVWHHHEPKMEGPTATLAVYIAETLSTSNCQAPLDTEQLQSAGLAHLIPQWQELASETSRGSRPC